MAIGTALVSVSDKTGLVEFCRQLSELGVQLLSTGGTARALEQQGIPVIPVSQYTGSPEILDGRVKTLHPKVHGGILAIRSNPEHVKTLEEHGIQPIDMVVVNLYPFVKTIQTPGVTAEEAIEQIDIGGPSMIRSAAKNHRDVTVVVDPADYPRVIAEMRAGNGGTSEAERRRLAQKAFEHTSSYDAAIATYFAGQSEKIRETRGTAGRDASHAYPSESAPLR